VHSDGSSVPWSSSSDGLMVLNPEVAEAMADDYNKALVMLLLAYTPNDGLEGIRISTDDGTGANVLIEEFMCLQSYLRLPGRTVFDVVTSRVESNQVPVDARTAVGQSKYPGLVYGPAVVAPHMPNDPLVFSSAAGLIANDLLLYIQSWLPELTTADYDRAIQFIVSKTNSRADYNAAAFTLSAFSHASVQMGEEAINTGPGAWTWNYAIGNSRLAVMNIVPSPLLPSTGVTPANGYPGFPPKCHVLIPDSPTIYFAAVVLGVLNQPVNASDVSQSPYWGKTYLPAQMYVTALAVLASMQITYDRWSAPVAALTDPVALHEVTKMMTQIRSLVTGLRRVQSSGLTADSIRSVGSVLWYRSFGAAIGMTVPLDSTGVSLFDYLSIDILNRMLAPARFNDVPLTQSAPAVLAPIAFWLILAKPFAAHGTWPRVNDVSGNQWPRMSGSMKAKHPQKLLAAANPAIWSIPTPPDRHFPAIGIDGVDLCDDDETNDWNAMMIYGAYQVPANNLNFVDYSTGVNALTRTPGYFMDSQTPTAAKTEALMGVTWTPDNFAPAGGPTGTYAHRSHSKWTTPGGFRLYATLGLMANITKLFTQRQQMIIPTISVAPCLPSSVETVTTQTSSDSEFEAAIRADISVTVSQKALSAPDSTTADTAQTVTKSALQVPSVGGSEQKKTAPSGTMPSNPVAPTP